MTSNRQDDRLVVGIDGSRSALRAATWTGSEALRRGRSQVHLVHAVTDPAATYVGGPGPPQDFFDQLNSDGRRFLDEAAAAVREVDADLDVKADLQRANPAAALIEESNSARLVVLGSRGLGGLSGMLAGSTACAVVAHGHCPVAVVRGRQPDDPPPTEGPVIVGVDGSPASEAAVALAFEEASLRDVDLVAVHTWTDYSSDSAYARASLAIVDWSPVENQQAEMLAERLAGWQEEYPDVTVHRVVTRDRPVRHLVEQAAQAQLLVVGSRGRGGFRGMLLGSTSQALIYHTPCPLLVARASVH